MSHYLLFSVCIFTTAALGASVYGGAALEENNGQSGEDGPTLGVLVTGGWASDGVSSSPELFIPGTNQSCHLPDMVTAREGHSLASLLACGGYGDDGANCETFSEDLGWQLEPFKLTRKRTGHISWSLNNGSVLLMGGLNSDRTTEMITPGIPSVSQPSFQLKYLSYETCGIPDSRNDHLYMTGNWYGYLSNQVTQYGPEGYLADLPLLNTGRHNHACAGYYTEDNIVLMVAGGRNFLTGYLSSTERLEVGVSAAWQEVAQLPVALWGARAVSLDNNILVMGGREGQIYHWLQHSEVLLWQETQANWTQVGRMTDSRYNHAVTAINLDQHQELLTYC